jgi:hypothetical protein
VINRWTKALAIALACVVATGCGNNAPVEGLPGLLPTPFDTAAVKAEAVTKAAKDAAQERAPVPPLSEAPAQAVAAYEYPFPDRTDLFEPRKHAARVARLSSGESTESVALLGFADIDEPRVVLAINGEAKALRSGEEALGIQVISIDPPRAVLQRGRSRWTVSIE